MIKFSPIPDYSSKLWDNKDIDVTKLISLVKVLSSLGCSFGGDFKDIEAVPNKTKFFMYAKYHNYTIKNKDSIKRIYNKLLDLLFIIKFMDDVETITSLSLDDIYFGSVEHRLPYTSSRYKDNVADCYLYFSTDKKGHVEINISFNFDSHSIESEAREMIYTYYPFNSEYKEALTKQIRLYNSSLTMFSRNIINSDYTLAKNAMKYYYTGTRYNRYTKDDSNLVSLRSELDKYIFLEGMTIFKLKYNGDDVIATLAKERSTTTDLKSITGISFVRPNGEEISIVDDENISIVLDKLLILGGI